MSVSEENMPDHGGADNEKVTKMEDHFLQTFQRLRVERYENRLRAEERKWQRIKMGSQSSNSTVGFDSTHRAEHTSPIHTIRSSRSFGASSSSSLEINEVGTPSARRELFRLGKRYASQSSRLQSSPSIITEEEDAKDHHLKSKDLFPSPTCSSANIGLTPPLENKGGVVNESHLLFNSNARSVSAPIETYNNSGTFVVTPDEKSTSKEDIGIYGCHYLLLARANDSPATQYRNNNIENGSNLIDDNEDRSDSSASSAPHLQAASACNSHGEQDDSGCEDNHSCGELQQGDDTMKKLDHFSSFCRAQVLISEIEIKSTRPQQEEESPACQETDSLNCNSVQSHKIKKKWKIKLIIRSILAAVSLAAICFGLRYITSWYKLAYPDWSLRDAFAAQYHACMRSLQWIYLSARTLKNALQSRLTDALSQTVLICNRIAHHLAIWLETLWGALRLMHSKVDDGYEQLLLLRNHAASNLTHWAESLLSKLIVMYTNWLTSMADRLELIILFLDQIASHVTLWIRWALDVSGLIHLEMMNRLDQFSLLLNHVASSLAQCAKSILSKPINAYTNWRNNFDIVSFIIVRIYRLEKIYYELLEMLNVTKHRMVEVQQSSILAWNMTLSTAISFWQQLKSVQAFNHTTQSFNTQEDLIIRRSAITRTPLIFLSRDGDGSMAKPSVNETLSQLVTGVDTKIEETMSPQFWRGIVKGKPFMKQTRHQSIHNIPSLAPQLEAGQTSSIVGSSDFSGLWNSQSGLSYPLVQLRHPRLSLDNPRLESIISSDIRDNMATSLVIQKTKPPKQQPQAIKPEKRNYYVSSYPLEMQSHEKDVFDNVDVMEMAREFVGKVLQRRSSKKTQVVYKGPL